MVAELSLRNKTHPDVHMDLDGLQKSWSDLTTLERVFSFMQGDVEIVRRGQKGIALVHVGGSTVDNMILTTHDATLPRFDLLIWIN